MGYINYFCGIVKVLENPLQTFVTDQISLTVARAELPQARNQQLLTLQFWGNLGRDLQIYYQPNDYVLIEGYISTSNKSNITIAPINSQQIILTVLKVYPLVLTGAKNFENI